MSDSIRQGQVSASHGHVTFVSVPEGGNPRVWTVPVDVVAHVFAADLEAQPASRILAAIGEPEPDGGEGPCRQAMVAALALDPRLHAALLDDPWVGAWWPAEVLAYTTGAADAPAAPDSVPRPMLARHAVHAVPAGETWWLGWDGTTLSLARDDGQVEILRATCVAVWPSRHWDRIPARLAN